MPRFNNLNVSTLREFDGGWNVVTSSLNLPTKYSTIEENMFYGLSGTKQKRYGTTLLQDLTKFLPITEIWDSVDVVDKQYLQITQESTVRVSAYDTIEITDPAVLEGEYKVLYTKHIDTNDYFVIDTTGIDLSTVTGITFNKKGLTTSATTSNFTADTSTDLKFTPGSTHSSLLIGHNITINSPVDIAGTYVVTKRETDENNVLSFYVTLPNGTYSSSYSDVSTTNENRNMMHTDPYSDNRIINITYFVNKLICVTKYGEVLAVDGKGNSIVLFNNQIAQNIGASNGWSETHHVCFAVFNGKLTIWNGVNKPLVVDLYLNIPCNYLVDESTQSNSMIPIGKYAVSINHYLVVGNIFDEQLGEWKPDRIMISDYDAIGTFNDGTQSTLLNGGVTVDLGKIVESSTSEIKGLSRYRTQLIASFDEVSAFGTLGNMIDTEIEEGGQTIEYQVHKPDFSDVISDYGCISNRTFQSIVGDTAALSFRGLGIFKKSALSSLTISTRLSTLIGTEMYKSFKDLSEEALSERIWSVYNPKEQQYLLFIPNNSTYETTTETVCFAYTVPNAHQARSVDGAWSKFTGWNFQCGCTSVLNEVFLVNGTKIYVLGNVDAPVYADFINDSDYIDPDDPECIDDDGNYLGTPIKFCWEFGWQDLGNRQQKKSLRYISLSSNGKAAFTFGTNYDYLVEKDGNNNELCEQQIQLVGGDSVGYGNGKQNYGGGRRTNSELLFAYTAKFNLIRIKMFGESREDLKINSLSLFYQGGNIRR